MREEECLFELDADGELEHILPVCLDSDCSTSQIYVRDNNQVKLKKKACCLWRKGDFLSGIYCLFNSVMV